MFYKFENENWESALEIHFPDGTILSADNKIEKDGWVWMDSPPEGFENSATLLN